MVIENYIWILVFRFIIDDNTFLHQGAKLEVLNLLDPPFVTKMNPSMGSEEYDMEGITPDIWFALQVDLIRIDTFWISFGKDFYFSPQSIMNFTFSASEPPDMSFGSLNPDGNWTGMVGELVNQNADIGTFFWKV